MVWFYSTEQKQLDIQLRKISNILCKKQSDSRVSEIINALLKYSQNPAFPFYPIKLFYKKSQTDA